MDTLFQTAKDTVLGGIKSDIVTACLSLIFLGLIVFAIRYLAHMLSGVNCHPLTEEDEREDRW